MLRGYPDRYGESRIKYGVPLIAAPIGQLHVDRAVFDRNGIGLYTERLPVRRLPRLQIELPAVTRTGDQRAFQGAAGDRPALMGAAVPNRIEPAVDIEDGQSDPGQGEQFGRAGLELGEGGDFNLAGHD